MRHHHTGIRPHVQGSGRALRVRHSARNLTDGGGTVLVRKLFDRLGLAGWIDRRAEKEKGFFRPSLMTEVWIVLLLYGGRVMDDLPLLNHWGVRRIFGWIRVPDPTTFGRWLRRAGERMVPLLDELLWRMVRQRWALAGRRPGEADADDGFDRGRALREEAGQRRGELQPVCGRPRMGKPDWEAGRWRSGTVVCPAS
ncbi:MAG: hypothetical protein OXL34_08400 [Gemmatimonadota bacterium]|nr:hypothetical protein [Gemmatimonadota bacterium]